jgi:hypothetical protein
MDARHLIWKDLRVIGESEQRLYSLDAWRECHRRDRHAQAGADLFQILKAQTEQSGFFFSEGVLEVLQRYFAPIKVEAMTFEAPELGSRRGVREAASGLMGAASTECFPSPRLNFWCGQVFPVRCDCPHESEGVLHFAIVVTPELVPYGRQHFAAGREGFRPCSVGIGQIQSQPYRASRAVRFASEFRENVIQHHNGVRDADTGVQQTPIR